MKRGSINLTFSFDLDMVTGWGNTIADWKDLAEKSLGNINSYKTKVEVHETKITNYVWRDIDGNTGGWVLPEPAPVDQTWENISRLLLAVETMSFDLGEWDANDPSSTGSYAEAHLAQQTARRDLEAVIKPMIEDAMKWRSKHQEVS